MTTNQHAADHVLECPCRRYATVKDIRQSLSSEETIERFIHWISGRVDESSVSQRRPLSCSTTRTPPSKCSQRVRASVDILNAIRDVCQLFMEKPANPPRPPAIKAESYDDAFPSLPKPTNTSKGPLPPPTKSKPIAGRPVKVTANQPTKGKKKPTPMATKPKRRLQPTPATSVSVPITTSGTVGAAIPGGFHLGNISCLPSEEPLPLDNLAKDSQPKGPTKESVAVTTTLTARPKPKELAASRGLPEVNKPTAHPQETEASSLQRDRLAYMYTTIIKCLMVPSTSIELIVLFEMLSVSETRTIPLEIQRFKDIVFAPIFPTPRSCRCFATTSLKHLSSLLKNLSWPIQEAIVRCPIFNQVLPELAGELTVLVEENRHVWTAFTRNGPGETPTALLTVPFDRNRDSRNNYKSRGASALYQNREETRDAFLYQLRSFLNIRGKVLDVVQASKMMDNVRSEARNVLNGVLSANMAWFAQFFCELLLQIGLIPLEEMDKDLLKITDRETLQKLHRRFSSKESNLIRTSRKPVLLKSADTGSSPADEAQLLFTGHQEFFYMFIMSTNSYSFGMHLRRRISGLLIDMVGRQITTAQDADAHISQSQLLAKFLGVLAFAPNWTKSDFDQLPPIIASGAQDIIEELAGIGLNARDLLEASWKSGQLLSTVPWILALLQMAKWDPSIFSSENFVSLLSWLRTIQVDVVARGASQPAHCNYQLVSLYLETFFGTVIGLHLSYRLPLAMLPEITGASSNDEKSKFPDAAFSNYVVYSASPPLEELVILLNDLSRDAASGPLSPTKKLRPYGISHHVRDSKDQPAKSGLNFHNESNKLTRIQSKLVDAFFHQHSELKEICFMASNRISSNLTSWFVATLNLDALQTLEHESIESSITEYIAFMKKNLDGGMRQVLEIMSPNETPKEILEVAIALTVSNALHIGETNMRSQLATEWKRVMSSRDRKKVKVTSESDGCLRMTAAAKLLTQLKWALHSSYDNYTMENLVRESEKVVQFFEDWNDGDIEIPPEAILRVFYESVFALDKPIANFLAEVLKLSKDPWPVSSLLLTVTTMLSVRTKRGLKNTSTFLKTENNLAILLDSAFDCSTCAGNSDDISPVVSSLVADLVVSKLVDAADLEGMLQPFDRSSWRKDVWSRCLVRLESLAATRHLLLSMRKKPNES